MGAKTWMLVYSNGDIPSIWQKNLPLKRENLKNILISLFPEEKFTEIEPSSLSFTCPQKNEVHIADLSEILIVSTEEVAIDYPSKIPKHFIDYSNYKYIYLFAMHSVVDWFAFAVWEDKELIRSLSLSPDSGILEDIGNKLPFELDYWQGKSQSLDQEDGDDYPLPFHPLDFGESALLNLMGYQFEGIESLHKVDPETIETVCFKSVKQWWKFW